MFKLKAFPCSNMLPIQGAVRGGTHIKLGLHIDNVGETKVGRVWLKEALHEEGMGFHGGTPKM
jgi:hypothetical protein